jgi:hypothetical protein
VTLLSPAEISGQAFKQRNLEFNFVSQNGIESRTNKKGKNRIDRMVSLKADFRNWKKMDLERVFVRWKQIKVNGQIFLDQTLQQQNRANNQSILSLFLISTFLEAYQTTTFVL